MTVHNLINKRPANDAQERGKRIAEQQLGYHAHNVAITALALALAKHFVVASDNAEVRDFLKYFTDQAAKMAAQTGVAVIEVATAEKASELAAMLLDKHLEARGG